MAHIIIARSSAPPPIRWLMLLMMLWISLHGLACSPKPANESTVCVAASLSDVIEELAGEYRSQTGATLRLHAAASGTLRSQIELGAPCDLFLSADITHIYALKTRGRLKGESVELARNRLVIAVRQSSATALSGPADLLDAAFRRVAVAEPEVAPVGRYARDALNRLDLWQPLSAKLVFADDARAAATLVATSAVDAAIVYATDLRSQPGLTNAYTFPTDLHDPIVYVGAAVSSSEIAKAFLEFLRSPAAHVVWQKHGFAIHPTADRQP